MVMRSARNLGGKYAHMLPASVPVVAVFNDGGRYPVIAWGVQDANDFDKDPLPVLIGYIIGPRLGDTPDQHVWAVDSYDGEFDHYEYVNS